MTKMLNPSLPASGSQSSGMQTNPAAKRVPFLPADLPFNDEQKQWMGGFLAGLHTRLLVKGDSQGASGTTAAAPVVRPVTILFGSQTGNAESVAEDLAAAAKAQGLAPKVIDMDEFDLATLPAVERLFIVTSTYGEGEMPDNAQALWDAISAEDAPRLENTYFSVLALGDTSYDEFCLAGKLWDERLEQLGAQRIGARVDCDVAFDAPAASWIAEVVPVIAAKGSAGGAATDSASADDKPKKAKSQYNRNNPLEAELRVKKVLTSEGSSKEIVHYEFSLAGTGETYDAGDALNILADNRADLVADLLQVLNAKAEDTVIWNNGQHQLGKLLTSGLEIRTPSKELVVELAKVSGDDELNRLLENQDPEGLNDYLWGKDVVDLLIAHKVNLSVERFCQLSKPLAARAYSISSSINAHAEEVHLTIGSVRYHQEGRDHNGVCSTWLADIADVGAKVKCYFSPNKNFAVPADNNLPMIMVGPGTGIAPFRAFLEEREARGAKGDNWLFFGDRNSQTDFIYREEIEALQASGLLTRLDLAFSRDQDAKIYVQDRMREKGAELFNWLERGGYFYICGDAYRMAKDVDQALHQIVEKHGNKNALEAEAYVNELKKQKRYVRDVY